MNLVKYDIIIINLIFIHPNSLLGNGTGVRINSGISNEGGISEVDYYYYYYDEY